jgi:hypothetical protein
MIFFARGIFSRLDKLTTEHKFGRAIRGLNPYDYSVNRLVVFRCFLPKRLSEEPQFFKDRIRGIYIFFGIRNCSKKEE